MPPAGIQTWIRNVHGSLETRLGLSCACLMPAYSAAGSLISAELLLVCPSSSLTLYVKICTEKPKDLEVVDFLLLLNLKLRRQISR